MAGYGCRLLLDKEAHIIGHKLKLGKRAGHLHGDSYGRLLTGAGGDDSLGLTSERIAVVGAALIGREGSDAGKIGSIVEATYSGIILREVGPHHDAIAAGRGVEVYIGIIALADVAPHDVLANGNCLGRRGLRIETDDVSHRATGADRGNLDGGASAREGVVDLGHIGIKPQMQTDLRRVGHVGKLMHSTSHKEQRQHRQQHPCMQAAEATEYSGLVWHHHFLPRLKSNT